MGATVTAFSAQSNDMLGITDSGLRPLQDGGGGILTHALLANSPAIDAGDDSQCPAEDQRGVARADGDGDGLVRCDIGAAEYVPIVFTVSLASWPDIDINYNADAYYSLFRSDSPYDNYVEVDQSGLHHFSQTTVAPSFWSIRSPNDDLEQTFGLFPFALEYGGFAD